MNQKIVELKPYGKNAKKHPKQQVELIAASIKRFGFDSPIIVDKNNEIIAGHGRLEAAKLLGLEEVPTIKKESLTPAEVKAYRLADNKIAESEWDMGLAIEDLKELDEELLSLTGFSQDLLVEPDEKDDVIPENAPTIAQLGDIWQLGQHRVMCGDSTQLEAVQRLMGDKKADLWLTDPPYNVNYTGKTKDALRIENDKKDDSAFLEFLVEGFTNAVTFLKPGGAYYIWHADLEGYNFRKACKDSGLTVRQCLIWNKNTLVMGRQDYHWKHEPCLYGWKDGASHLWNADRTQTTVLNFDRPTQSKVHPTMKPIELLAYQITNNTKGEDIVLDTFLGSGSTLIAAEKTGRVCYGAEISPAYCDVIIKRWEDYTGQKAIKAS